jgi:hypothetical protein
MVRRLPSKLVASWDDINPFWSSESLLRLTTIVG